MIPIGLSTEVANAWFEGLASFVSHLTGTNVYVKTIPFGVEIEKGLGIVRQNFELINGHLASWRVPQPHELCPQHHLPLTWAVASKEVHPDRRNVRICPIQGCRAGDHQA